jgi:hypothetical protein
VSKVRIEQNGPVTSILINRPEVRNAVDLETADQLRSAFTAFEADGASAVAGGLELALRCDRVRECGLWRALSALGRSADRRRHDTTAASHRAEPRPRHDPDRASC